MRSADLRFPYFIWFLFLDPHVLLAGLSCGVPGDLSRVRVYGCACRGVREGFLALMTSMRGDVFETWKDGRWGPKNGSELGWSTLALNLLGKEGWVCANQEYSDKDCLVFEVISAKSSTCRY
jgi:hypothetical protein